MSFSASDTRSVAQRLSGGRPIVLFDGVCNLCNASVDFLIQRDPEAKFRFASLQSEQAEQLLPDHDRHGEMESSILVADGVIYRKSTAALRIAWMLPFPWPLLFVGILIPAPIRDVIYNWIGKNRYRWFGKKESCRLPTPAERARFLDS